MVVKRIIRQLWLLLLRCRRCDKWRERVRPWIRWFIQRLEYEYSKYLDLDKTPSQPSILTETQSSIIQDLKPWSQRAKNSFTFMPIVSVDEFFKDSPDKPHSALRIHPLERSPCYPIINVRPAGRHILYRCVNQSLGLELISTWALSNTIAIRRIWSPQT